MKRYVLASKEEYTVSNPPPGWEIRNLDGVDTWININDYEVAYASYDKIKQDFAQDLNNIIGYDLLSGPIEDGGIYVDNGDVKYTLTFESNLNCEYDEDNWASDVLGDVRTRENTGIFATVDESGKVDLEADISIGITADHENSVIEYVFSTYDISDYHMETIQIFYDHILKNFKSHTKQVFNVNTSIPGTQSFIDKLTSYLNTRSLCDTACAKINCPLKFSNEWDNDCGFHAKNKEEDSLTNYTYGEIFNCFIAYDDTYALTNSEGKTQKFKLKCAPVYVTCHMSSERNKSKMHTKNMYVSELYIQIDVPSYYESDEITEKIVEELGDVESWYQKIITMISTYIKSHCKEVSLSSKKIPRAELEFDEWYNGSQYEEEGAEFVENVTSKLEKKYPGADIFDEPSVQGGMGTDYWTITMQDGTTYVVEFKYDDQVDTIFSLGPKRAATQYANEINRKIKSGEALVED